MKEAARQGWNVFFWALDQRFPAWLKNALYVAIFVSQFVAVQTTGARALADCASPASRKKSGALAAAALRSSQRSVFGYFKFAIAVRSNLPETTNVELHQFEPTPVGLMAE
jgi:hypothetical protein